MKKSLLLSANGKGNVPLMLAKALTVTPQEVQSGTLTLSPELSQVLKLTPTWDLVFCASDWHRAYLRPAQWPAHAGKHCSRREIWIGRVRVGLQRGNGRDGGTDEIRDGHGDRGSGERSGFQGKGWSMLAPAGCGRVSPMFANFCCKSM